MAKTKTTTTTKAETHTHGDGTVHHGATHGNSNSTATSHSSNTMAKENITTTTASAATNAVSEGMPHSVDATGNSVDVDAGTFKNLFGGIFKKKKDGEAVANYTLNNIKFNAENHKIENFSKNEVMGLADALKAYPNSKVKVQVYTNDSDNDKKNKKLSKSRAQVVRDMLVTLGVDEKQISHDGMGAGEAAGDVVEIVVE